MLANPKAAWDHPAYTMVAKAGQPVGLAVSTERFRYLENADGSSELFDIQNDLREWKNLIDNAEYIEALAQLKILAGEYKVKFRQEGK